MIVKVFLDISKAFDRIGHRNVEKCLAYLGQPSSPDHVFALFNNTIRIGVGNLIARYSQNRESFFLSNFARNLKKDLNCYFKSLAN